MTTELTVQPTPIPEVMRLGRRLSELYERTPVTVFTGQVAQYEGLALYAVGGVYPSPAGAGRDNAEIDIQIKLRTHDFREAYRIVGFLSRQHVVIGPIAMDMGPPVAELGAAEIDISTTILASIEFPEGFLDEPSMTERITITYVHGEEVLGMDTVDEATS